MVVLIILQGVLVLAIGVHLIPALVGILSPVAAVTPGRSLFHASSTAGSCAVGLCLTEPDLLVSVVKGSSCSVGGCNLCFDGIIGSHHAARANIFHQSSLADGGLLEQGSVT